jgi:hypothetical protein
MFHILGAAPQFFAVAEVLFLDVGCFSGVADLSDRQLPRPITGP